MNRRVDVAFARVPLVSRDGSIGTSPNTNPVARVMSVVNATTRASTEISAMRGKSARKCAINAGMLHSVKANPKPLPKRARMTLSVSSCCVRRPRLAPKERSQHHLLLTGGCAGEKINPDTLYVGAINHRKDSHCGVKADSGRTRQIAFSRSP